MPRYKDNLFVRYGDPKEPEEVITDALISTLEKGSPELKDSVASLISPVPLDNPSFKQERTAIALESALSNKEIYLVGLSNIEAELPGLSENEDITLNQRRFDVVIEDEENIIIIEIKTHDSSFQKLDEYVDLLGITSQNRIDFYRWSSLTDALSDVELSNSLERELVADFCELIKFNSIAETIRVSSYGDNNTKKNHLKITHRTDNIRKTPYADSDPIFALQIESDKEGAQTIRFTPGEWTELINQLNTEERKAIKNADFSAFERYEGNGQTIHASVGQKSTHQKVLQTATTDGHFAVGFKHRNPGKSVYHGQGAFPMLTKSEFNTLFNKFSQEQRQRLVKERDLTVFIEDLDK